MSYFEPKLTPGQLESYAEIVAADKHPDKWGIGGSMLQELIRGLILECDRLQDKFDHCCGGVPICDRTDYPWQKPENDFRNRADCRKRKDRSGKGHSNVRPAE